MKTIYVVSGFGRKVGSLGTSSTFTIGIEASSKEDAKLKVYNHYEHIQDMDISDPFISSSQQY